MPLHPHRPWLRFTHEHEKERCERVEADFLAKLHGSSIWVPAVQAWSRPSSCPLRRAGTPSRRSSGALSAVGCPPKLLLSISSVAR